MGGASTLGSARGSMNHIESSVRGRRRGSMGGCMVEDG